MVLVGVRIVQGVLMNGLSTAESRRGEEKPATATVEPNRVSTMKRGENDRYVFSQGDVWPLVCGRRSSRIELYALSIKLTTVYMSALRDTPWMNEDIVTSLISPGRCLSWQSRPHWIKRNGVPWCAGIYSGQFCGLAERIMRKFQAPNPRLCRDPTFVSSSNCAASGDGWFPWNS